MGWINVIMLNTAKHGNILLSCLRMALKNCSVHVVIISRTTNFFKTARHYF